MTERLATVAHSSDAPQPNDLYVGRAVGGRGGRPGRASSVWHNPFKFARTGFQHIDRPARFDVVRRYATMLAGSSELKPLLQGLTGHRLICWCRHRGHRITYDTLCHADVLALAIPYGLEFDDRAAGDVMEHLKRQCESADQLPGGIR